MTTNSASGKREKMAVEGTQTPRDVDVARDAMK